MAETTAGNGSRPARPKRRGRGERFDLIVGVLAENKEGLTPIEIARATGMGVGNVGQALHLLEKRGEIHRQARGLWADGPRAEAAQVTGPGQLPPESLGGPEQTFVSFPRLPLAVLPYRTRAEWLLKKIEALIEEAQPSRGRAKELVRKIGALIEEVHPHRDVRCHQQDPRELSLSLAAVHLNNALAQWGTEEAADHD